MEDDEVAFLGGGGDEQVGDLAAALAAGGQQALHLPGPADVLGRRLDELEGVEGALVRRMRCGKAGCACKGDPPALHGPYTQWTRTVAGRTVTRFLSEDELARYQPWFDNAWRLKELVAKLEIASVHALEAERRRKSPAASKSPASRRGQRSG